MVESLSKEASERLGLYMVRGAPAQATLFLSIEREVSNILLCFLVIYQVFSYVFCTKSCFLWAVCRYKYF